MGNESKYPPDTSWMSEPTARRLRRVLGSVILAVVLLVIIDDVFFDRVAARTILYLFKGSGPPGGF
jgi:hypothetical protein